MSRVGRAVRRDVLARLALATCVMLVSPAAPAVELPRIDDLSQLAAQLRRQRIPLLLFFSTPGCPYCLEVRRNYLAQRLKEDAGTLLIREVDITSRRSLAGPAGKRVTEAELARQFGVRMAPVVQLVDADLTRLGEPLVGVDAAGFYEAYLSRNIEEAQRAVRAR